MGGRAFSEKEVARATKFRRAGKSWTEIGERLKRNGTSVSKAVQRDVGHDPIGEVEAKPNGSKPKTKPNGSKPAKKKRRTKGWQIVVRFNGRELGKYGVDMTKGAAILEQLEGE